MMEAGAVWDVCLVLRLGQKAHLEKGVATQRSIYSLCSLCPNLTSKAESESRMRVERWEARGGTFLTIASVGLIACPTFLALLVPFVGRVAELTGRGLLWHAQSASSLSAKASLLSLLVRLRARTPAALAHALQRQPDRRCPEQFGPTPLVGRNRNLHQRRTRPN
jgi:hypothetical protein